MSQVKRQIFRVYPLGGMDLRWHPERNKATLVRDLTWDQRAGWTNSGGYAVIATDGATGGTSGTDDTESAYSNTVHPGTGGMTGWV